MLLKKLTETPGVPGYEDRIREVVLEELKPLVDETWVDRLGNIIGHRKGEGPRVMVAAHMDEIGFIVSHIDEKGFLRFALMGGFDPRVLIAQRVIIHGREDVRGVIGTKPIHILDEEERKKALQVKDLHIDTALPREEVIKRVSVGDTVTLEGEFTELNEKAYCAKAFDDRIGIYIIIEALKRLKKHKADIYVVATTQEEVGLRGAIASSYAVEPDIGIAVDITIAADVPGSKDHESVTRLGEGAAIKIMDTISISDKRIVNFLKGIAEERKIKYQMEILPRGGTDAGAMQRSRGGVHVATISIPTRYAHSVVEVISRDDIENSIRLLCAFLEEAHKVEL
jgi:endoglucanase